MQSLLKTRKLWNQTDSADKKSKIKQIINKEDTKKDWTKKLCTLIIKMIGRTDESEAIPATCTCFLNSDNVGMAQCELVHQFKELGFPDIGIAQDTAPALYVGDSQYANSSTPKNFTILAYHEQEPLLDSR